MQIHDTKTCTKCGETKPLSGFHKDTTRPSGLFPQCKTCVCARASTWYAENTERGRATSAAWRKKNPGRKGAYAGLKRYRARHPDNTLSWNARYRARKRNAPVVEQVDRTAIYERDGGICHICKKHVAPKDMSLDHLVPLSLGGEHTERNLALAHNRCNMRRGAGRIPAQLRCL